MNVLQYLLSLIRSLYFKYELVTCLYMCEPWEVALCHCLTLLAISLITYSSYMYLPTYMTSLWNSTLHCKDVLTDSIFS